MFTSSALEAGHNSPAAHFDFPAPVPTMGMDIDDDDDDDDASFSAQTVDSLSFDSYKPSSTGGPRAKQDSYAGTKEKKRSKKRLLSEDLPRSKGKRLFGLPSAEMPRNNPPASTSMLEATATQPASADEIAKQDFLGRLVAVQQFDGSFPPEPPAVLSSENVRSLCGDDFMDLVRQIMMEASSIGLGEMAEYETAVGTVAIMILLDLHFQSCKDLWQRMYDKAKEYLDRHFHAEYRWLGSRAKRVFRSFKIPMLQSSAPARNTDFARTFGFTTPKPVPTVYPMPAPSENSSSRGSHWTMRRLRSFETRKSKQPSPPAVRNPETSQSEEPSILEQEIAPARRMSLDIAPFNDDA